MPICCTIVACAVEFAVSDAVALKVDFATIHGSDEPVIALWNERLDDTVCRRLVHLDVALPLTDQILQLVTCYVESVSNGDLNILMPACGRRIATYRNIRGAGNREVKPNAIRVALMMAMLRPPYDDTGRRDAIAELLELRGLLARALLDIVNGCDVLESDLQRNLHDHATPSFRQDDALRTVRPIGH